MRGGGPPGGFYPAPSRLLRLAGILGLLGALLWPITLIILASAASTCTATSCPIERGPLLFVALSPVCLALTMLALERRAQRTPGLSDLIGDLTIGTAAALFVLAFVSGSIGLVGPGLLLLLIGSLVFGIAGYRTGARQRLASATVAIAAGATLLLLFGGAAGAVGSDLEGPSIAALLLFSVGWAWLGVHLLLGRPLPIPPRPEPEHS